VGVAAVAADDGEPAQRARRTGRLAAMAAAEFDQASAGSFLVGRRRGVPFW
jgi:hypothetical protein